MIATAENRNLRETPTFAMTAHRLASFDPKDVGAVLLADFRAAAGSQALFRAFLAERDNDRFGARFWLDAYEAIVKASS
ncbi:MAG: hypothetical protein WB764_28270 [Xanthobacteraceae bacterium]